MAGPFVFFDLRTPDPVRSQRFYAGLAGFEVKEQTAGDTVVRLLTDDAGIWGGVTPLPEGDERPPSWVPYIGVDDVDAAAAEAVRLGATVARPRADLPAGSAVVITDPCGATVCLWQAA